MEKEKKRFPADTSLDITTFLNDKKINAELYAILQEQSSYRVIDKSKNQFETYILKKNMPKQKWLCEKLGIKSPKTLRAHLTYLIQKGFLQEVDDSQIAYILPEAESIYFLIPKDTLNYLNDNCKEHVIKLYIYLGQRYKYAIEKGFNYEFTLEQLGQHIGINVKNNSEGYRILNNALDLLQNSGLIKFASFFDGSMQKKRLVGFSFEYISKNR